MSFIDSAGPFAYHGDYWAAGNSGQNAGEFAFNHNTGTVNNNNGSRLLEVTIICVSLYYCFLIIDEYYRGLIPVLEIDKNVNNLL